ncbi:MAG: DMT family transporter [Pseudomonadota bacterium]
MPRSIQLIVALVAFAANSFFCRYALADESIDPGSFTWIRLLSGAVTLATLLCWQGKLKVSLFNDKLSWWSGAALFGYAICFSFAYTALSTGTGALILFGMVQLSLVAYYVGSGHRLSKIEILGITVALGGFVLLMMPSAQMPSLSAALLMVVAGGCWAAFTLIGRKAVSASVAITHGFVLAAVMALFASPLLLSLERITWSGVGWGVLSGVFASGFGYIVWYQVVKQISVLQASVAQLAVPVIAFIAGGLGLGEVISVMALISSALVLGGIAMIFIGHARQ